MSILAVATQFADSFEKKTRDDGTEFWSNKEGTAEWIKEAVQNAHNDMMPDDFRYRMIHQVADSIVEVLSYDIDADLSEERHERVDGLVSVYHHDRFRWLASNLARADYCDDANDEGLVNKEASLSDRIAIGWFAELEEIWESVVESLKEQADEEGDEEEEEQDDEEEEGDDA